MPGKQNPQGARQLRTKNVLLLSSAVDALVQEDAAADDKDDEGDGERADTRRANFLDGGAHFGLGIRAGIKHCQRHDAQIASCVDWSVISK